MLAAVQPLLPMRYEKPENLLLYIFPPHMPLFLLGKSLVGVLNAFFLFCEPWTCFKRRLGVKLQFLDFSDFFHLSDTSTEFCEHSEHKR